MDFLDKFRSMFPNAGIYVKNSSTDFVPIRQTPKGTYVEQQEDGSVTLRFKAVIRFWWGLPYILMAFTLVAALPLSVLFGSLLWIFILVSFTVLSFWLTRPWVELVANEHYIKIGSQYFDRAMYGGMRLGYELKGAEHILKNDFHDISMGMQALRLSYGPWGEDLPYLVNRYHATAIVMWLNYMIASTIRKPTEPTNLATGQRSQNF